MDPSLHLSFVFFLLKIYRNVNFCGKIDWSMNSGLEWAGDCIFKTGQKMLTKFGQFKKLKCREGSQLCKLSQLCYHYLLSFENINIFFDILVIPCPSRSKIHWQINLPKNWCFCIFSTTKKVTSLNRDIHPNDYWSYVCKNLWIVKFVYICYILYMISSYKKKPTPQG